MTPRTDPESGRRRYPFENLLRSDSASLPPPPDRPGEMSPGGRPGPGSVPSRWLIVGITAAIILIGLTVALLLSRSSSSNGSPDFEVPRLPSDTCTSQSFATLLGELDGGQLTTRGEATCEGSFALLPTQRQSAAGTEDLVSAFRSGPEGLWEHFATLDAPDCAALQVVDPQFPASLCELQS